MPALPHPARVAALARRLSALALAAWLLPAGALAQAPAAAREPGAGFVDPAGVPPRSAPADVDPVWRAPAVDTLATVRKRGVLRVCVVPVEPMVMHDTRGELVGFSIDLSRRLAQDLGVGVEFMPTSWAHVVPDLLGRHCDLIATGLWVTLQRALVLNFSQPTATEGIHLVASRTAAAGKAVLADFNRPGLRVAVHAGTQQEALARRLLPQAQLVQTLDDPLQGVAQGQADAALVPTLSPQALLKAAPDQLVLPLAAPLSATPTALAVRKGDPDFLRLVDTWLQLQRESGWLDERALHWSGNTDWLRR